MIEVAASRSEAKRKGLKHYFTGRPCKWGHIAERYTSGCCVLCGREASEKWRKLNLEKIRTYDRNWYRAKVGCPEPTRRRPDVCECCGKTPSRKRPLHLDHCHKTGRFRGWLCVNCNMGVGQLGDNIEGLQRAIVYLKRAAT